MLRTLIIDDEPHIRETLRHLLARFCPQVQVAGEADSVASGIREIREKVPDLVLLDIKMDDGTGFDLLNHFDNIDFKIIFITAYEKYAIEAFGYSAIDYLLKPVNPEKLAEAVSRAEQTVLKTFNTQVDTLKANLRTPDNRERRIILKTMESIYLLEVGHIIHCESEGNYTAFHTLDHGRIMVSRNLKEYNDLLSNAGFFRVHRSHLINLKHLRRFDKQDGGFVMMSNGDKVPVSSSGRERLDEETLARAYNGLAFYHSFSDADSAMFYAEKAFILSEKLDNEIEKGSAFRNMGNTYALAGNYPQAVQNLLQALDIFEKKGAKRKIMEVYTDLSKLNYDLEDYEGSIEYGKKIRSLYQSESAKGNVLANPFEYAVLIGISGGPPRESGDYPLAEAYFKEYLALSRDLDVPAAVHTVLVKSLAETYEYIGAYDSALKYTFLAREFLPGNAGKPSELQSGYEGSIGMLLLMNGKTGEALRYLKYSYHDNKNIDTYFYASKDAFRIGDIYLDQEKYDSAAYWYNAGLEDLDSLKYNIALEKSDTARQKVYTGYQVVMNINKTELLQRYYLMMVRAGESLSGLYKRTGDLELALKHREQMDLYKDSLNDIKDNIEERKLQVRFANEHMARQLDLLQKDNELQQFRLQNTRQVMGGIIGSVLLLTIMMFIFFRQRRIREVQDKLLLEQRLLRSQMNPHFIFNSLASVQNFIVRQDDKNASIYLARFSDLVRSILNNSREESITMEEEINTIENYLSLQKIRFPDKFDFIIDTDPGIDTESVMIPPMLAQPFIENSIEHGIKHKDGKGKIQIRIGRKNDSTIFEVEDDGVGREKARNLLLKQEESHKSLATVITRERIAALNRKSKKKITLEIIDLMDEKGNARGTLVRFGLPTGNHSFTNP